LDVRHVGRCGIGDDFAALDPLKSSVRIRREIVAAMCEEAAKTPTQECCGLLAGRDEVIAHIFAAENAHLQPATAYEIAPQELFRVMKKIRQEKLELLGIYHSHPHGENFPSRSDVERAFYPHTPYFILSPLPHAPQPVRAFLIRDDQVTELQIQPV
jgi:[CysO sulfur-carrier protein]-S-L-cysteine hydrolase